MKIALIRLALLVIVLALWQQVPDRLTFFLSRPSDIAQSLWSLVADGSLAVPGFAVVRHNVDVSHPPRVQRNWTPASAAGRFSLDP